MGGAAPNIPKAPNASKSYGAGAKVYLKYLPQLLAAEQSTRTTEDPKRITDQQGLETQFGPAHYQQQLDSLKTLDPTGTSLRNQLGAQVSDDLASGYGLPDGYRTELQNEFRGAQAARGNILGNAAGSAEAGFLGQAALAMHQQKLQNAGNFLAGATPEQRLLAVQPVRPDRSSQYVNPNSGYQGQQFALQNYQNLLAQTAASGGSGQSGWGRAANGAQQGMAIAGPWGAAGGAIDGYFNGPAYQSLNGSGGGGSSFSDRRLKENIVAKSGRLYEFNYRGNAKRFIGVMADEVKRIAPLAVRKATGFMSDFDLVDYGMLGLIMKEVG